MRINNNLTSFTNKWRQVIKREDKKNIVQERNNNFDKFNAQLAKLEDTRRVHSSFHAN